MKRIISLFLVVIILFSLSGCGTSQKYYDTANKAYNAIIVGGVGADYLTQQIHSTWHSAIFDDDTIYKEEYGLDFNDALSDLFILDVVVEWQKQIDESYLIADKYIEEFNDLSGDEDLKKNLLKLHDIFYNLKELAISPTGSLESYTDSLNEQVTEFYKYIDYVALDFPEDYDINIVEFTDEENAILYPDDSSDTAN